MNRALRAVIYVAATALVWLVLTLGLGLLGLIGPWEMLLTLVLAVVTVVVVGRLVARNRQVAA
jgi:hypothetical protein